jgi:ribosomal protein S18 acetylase RimI-like enzyme
MSSEPVELRAARPDEAGAIAGLVNDAYGRTETPSGWTSEDALLAGPRIEPDGVEALLEDGDSRVYVVDDDGVVACVQLERLDETTVEVGLLAVRPDLQGDGLGRAVLAAAEARALGAFGADRIVLEVITERTELLDWYERRGYEPTGETRAFEPDQPQRSLVGDLAFEVLEKRLR